MRFPFVATMLVLLLVSGLAWAPAGLAAPAATKSDVQALQAQLQALTERLDRLEASNAALQSQNAELQALAERRAAEAEYVKVQAQQAAGEAATASGDVAKLKGAEWASRIRLRGDLRYRHEHLEQERDVDGTAEDAADRDRQRIRARLGFDATVTDNLKATILLTTGGDDPRGTNQTLGGKNSRQSIGLDLAYADWRFAEGARLVLGKQPYPVWRPLNSLFLDADVNPEGGALRFQHDGLFASAYGFWLAEQYSTDPAGENVDALIYGLQAGTKLAVLGGETTLAANYYVCRACKDHSPIYANNANGNTTYRVGNVNVLQYGYDVLDFEAQLGTTLGSMPFFVTAGYARNLAAGVEYDTAWALGAYLGRAAEPGTWEVGAAYQSIDKDALFGQIVDSDFGNGYTDSQGWMLKAGYAPVKNVSLNTSLFLNTINKDVGTELDVRRLQLDVNYKF